MFHPFTQDIHSYLPVGKFNNPFHYQPHPLCIMASEAVQAYLKSRADWENEWQSGKMFGVLVVETPEGETGFLAAFSGILAGNYLHDYFVPPIYNLQQPDGFFKAEEEEISKINNSIRELESSATYLSKLSKLNDLKRESDEALANFKQAMKEAKKNRDLMRAEKNLTPEEEAALIKESQYQKAEFKRLANQWEKRLHEQGMEIGHLNQQLEAWKEERKKRSAELQKRLFKQFRLLNARGEIRDVHEIFSSTPQAIPPAGTGECAAPKLLQYAYLHQFRPLAIAEFWWGNSPATSIRHQGHYYPSCKSKCKPILTHMLEGLDVEGEETSFSQTASKQLEIVYEDEYLLIVNKPSGMLSVPGKSNALSVFDIISIRYPNATGPLIVHRLDMDTSGLLIIAKTKEVHNRLQQQFESRSVKKRYVALLHGRPSERISNNGFIKLPLRPDYENRPYQLVDMTNGKPSVTRYEILETKTYCFANGDKGVCTRIAFYPLTGRTHQLRVHAAHSLGLDTPIIGDPLYGVPDKRLYLHAEYLEFRHPATGKLIKAEVTDPF